MPGRGEIIERYNAIRRVTERLCEPLEVEDHVVQPMTDVSPPRWHLGHTSWFYETFVLAPHVKDYVPYHPQFSFLFNSYYNLVGDRTDRPRRGMLTRPTVREVMLYRDNIDKRVQALLSECEDEVFAKIAPVLEIGLQHEQQHQELLLTDIKYILFQSPLFPAYLPAAKLTVEDSVPVKGFTGFEGGVLGFGHTGEDFAYDNERPSHERKLPGFRLANGLVTNAEYLEFINDGGYSRSELWLSDGWDLAQQQKWSAPLYWLQRDGAWVNHTLYGLREVVGADPVTHISFYEANAFARWSDRRLPTEFEWEHAADKSEAMKRKATMQEDGRFHPSMGGKSIDGLCRMIGEVWEWTGSAYLPYPGYRTPHGAIGEYNGKFMVNQMVLRGGSIATPRSAIRTTYRNFWHPDKRWQFSGIRLAEDV